MSNHCVIPRDELSLSKLSKNVSNILEKWLQGDNTLSLQYLRLVHDQQQQEGSTAHQATITILEEAINALRQTASHGQRGRRITGQEYADLLYEHYWQGVSQNSLEETYNIGNPGLNKRLQSGRGKLAEIVYNKELQARDKHRDKQRKRLEKPTYQTLVGASTIQERLKALVIQPDAPWLIVIKGPGGSGKSAHTDCLLRQMIDEDHWDEVIWISFKQENLTRSGNIHELGQPLLTNETLLERLLEQFFPGKPKPDSFFNSTAMAMLEDRLKKGCPCCICIDDIEIGTDTNAILLTLQSLANPSKIILTTRVHLDSDDVPVAHFELPELSEQDALSLIRETAHASHLTKVEEIDDKDLRLIYQMVGGNPLALSLIAGQLQVLGLHQVLDGLKEATDDPHKNLFKYIYTCAWDHLEQSTRRVLLAMLFLCPQGGKYALLSHIMQMDKGELRKSLNKLMSLSLVQTRGSGNEVLLSLHNLTRTFLNEEVLKTVVNLSSEDEAELAAFDRHIYGAIDFITKEIQHTDQILREDERAQVLHILSYAIKLVLRDANAWPITRDLFMALALKFELAGYHVGWIPYVKEGIALSKANHDERSEALLQAHLGLLHRVIGDYENAHNVLILCAIYFEASGDVGNLAEVLTQRAHMYCIQRRHIEAKPLIQQASGLLTETDPRQEYICYVQGLLALNENDPIEAEQWFKKSLNFCEEQRDKRLIAKRLGNLGTALYAQGQLEQAQAYYERSIALFGEVHDDVQRAMMQMGVGNIYLLRQQPHRALEEFAKAEPSLSQAHEVLHLAMLNVNWAIAKRQLGEWQEAEERLLKAIARWQQLKDFHRLANAYYELGLLYREQQFTEKAKQAFNEALACLAKSEPSPGRDALQAKIAAALA